MAYFEITAKLEEVNESNYTIQSTGEIITKVQLSLVIPSMRDRLTCELPLDKAPKSDVLDRWELEESWVVVSADGLLAGARVMPLERQGPIPSAPWWCSRRWTCVRRAPTSARRCSRRARRRRSPPSSAARHEPPRSGRPNKRRNRHK